MTPVRIGSRWREKGTHRVVEVIAVRGKSVVYRVPLSRGSGVGDADWWHKFYDLVSEPTSAELAEDVARRVEEQ